MSWVSVWWHRLKEPAEIMAKTEVIAKIRELNLQEYADHLVRKVLKILSGYNLQLPDAAMTALEGLAAKEMEKLREKIIDAVKRIQL